MLRVSKVEGSNKSPFAAGLLAAAIALNFSIEQFGEANGKTPRMEAVQDGDIDELIPQIIERADTLAKMAFKANAPPQAA